MASSADEDATAAGVGVGADGLPQISGTTVAHRLTTAATKPAIPTAILRPESKKPSTRMSPRRFLGGGSGAMPDTPP